MNKQKKRLLLVWPPMTVIFGLPLGIASLAAYLKDRGVRDVEIFDANSEYLKKKDWVYRFKEHYRRFVSTMFPVPKNDALDRLFAYMLDVRKHRVPWSLAEIGKVISRSKGGIVHKRLKGLLRDVLGKRDFDLIGFSVFYPEQLFFAFYLSQIIKEEFRKDIRIAWGGAQVTEHIEDFRMGGGVLDFIDFFVEGDGEEPLLQLSEAITEDALPDIPNLYFKTTGSKRFDKAQGKFYWDARHASIPDFDGFNLDLYEQAAPLLASKGCVWSKCNFCIRPDMQQHRYLTVDPEKAFEIMTGLEQKHGFSNYHFVDDALLPGFLGDFSDILVRNHCTPRWSCSAIMSSEFEDKDFCDKLKRSGMASITFGLESVSPRILGLMNKAHKNMAEAGIAKIFHTLAHAGIRVGVHVIFGFPTETREEARETLGFLIRNKDLSMVSVQPFRIEAHTPIYGDPGKFGIIKMDKEDIHLGKRRGYRYDVASGMSQKEAVKFAAEAEKILKKSGKSVWRMDCFFNTFP